MPKEKQTYLRIYPGVPVLAWVWFPTKDVILKGEVYHFQNGMAGLTTSCALSNMWTDPKNSTRFQHPAKIGTAVLKSRAYVLTGEKQNLPRYAVYAHNHGNLVDMNDDKLITRIIQNHPEDLEREFEFRAVSDIKRKIKPSVRKTNVGLRKPFYPRGAIARAVKAGLMSLQEAQKRAQESQDAYEMQRLMGMKRRK